MTEIAGISVVLFAFTWLAIAGLLVAICATDLRERRIPNELVAALCVLWVLLQTWSWLCGSFAGRSLADAAAACGVPAFLLPLFALPSPLVGILAAGATVLLLGCANAVYERCSGKQAMGFGDVKLIGAFALFLGPVPTIVCVMVACVLALIAALPARLRTFPFAPALMLAFICVMVVEL